MSIKWTQTQYGGASARIGRIGTLSVAWDMAKGNGYLVSVLDHRLKTKFDSIADAQVAAEKFCRELLNEAIKQVEAE